ncbi:MAG: hypothetical protein IPG53_07115 [Ignavibacteriales bacterium]|nr:hypothetical protein [Ignavibacteriales bacterium]
MNQELTVSSGLPVYLYQEHLSNLFNRNRELIDSISLNYLCFDEQKEYFIHLMESFDQIEASAPIKTEINICKASKRQNISRSPRKRKVSS